MASCVGHEFKPRSTRPSVCLICHNEYNNKWMRADYELVKAASSEYKLMHGCALCGYKDNVLALVYDHIKPIRQRSRHPKVRMKQFLALINDPNVQVLCANCHSIKTHEEGSYQMNTRDRETV